MKPVFSPFLFLKISRGVSACRGGAEPHAPSDLDELFADEALFKTMTGIKQDAMRDTGFGLDIN